MVSENYILKKIETNDLCTGCGLCESLFGQNKISIMIDKNGYHRPVLHNDLTPSESELLSAVCPGLDVRHYVGSCNYDPIWGPLITILAAAAVDNEVRHVGSSGGVLSAIQIYLLESGKVDFVVATATSADNPCGTQINICRTRDDVISGAGSRYAPSSPLIKISQLLDAPGRFAFVGKPCDVAALRRLGQYDNRVTNKVRYFLSFMCAGVPSLHGTHSIIKNLGAQVGNVSSFRYRGDGWPGLTKATLHNGTILSMSYEESWGNILSQYIQWRCKVCPDGTGEFADISCADAWNLNSDGSPSFAEGMGMSFVLARSAEGKNLIDDVLRSDVIRQHESVGCQYLQAVQFHQSYRRRTMLSRYLALNMLFKRHPLFNIKYLLLAAVRINIVYSIRALLGTLKRAVASRQDSFVK